MSNTEQMVSVPRSLLEEACNGLRITQDRARKELRALLAQPDAQPLGWVYEGGQEFTSDPDRAHDLRAEGIDLTAVYGHAQHQGEPVAWSTDKPEAPGAYWIRGFNLSGEFKEAALVQVVRDEDADCLMVNLHQSTTESDTGYWYEVDDINAEFEWSGPLYAHPAAGEVEQGYHNSVVEGLMSRQNELREERDTLRAEVDQFKLANARLSKENVDRRNQLAERDAALDALNEIATGYKRGLVKADYVIDHARTIDEQAFALGTQNVDPGLFRGLGNLLEQYDDALSASAEPSAPVERDELKPCPFCGCQVTFLTGREDYRIAGKHGRACPLVDTDVVVDSREAWQARAALERKP